MGEPRTPCTKVKKSFRNAMLTKLSARADRPASPDSDPKKAVVGMRYRPIVDILGAATYTGCNRTA